LGDKKDMWPIKTLSQGSLLEQLEEESQWGINSTRFTWKTAVKVVVETGEDVPVHS